MSGFLLVRLKSILFLKEYAESDPEGAPWVIGFVVVLFLGTALVRYFSGRNK
ncbi:hypothetical protein [Anaerotignum sp.]